jgi:isoleucyl-tRNA synthetase
VVFFEGPDQHRGWFNSSLMVGTGITGRAPYTDVGTHGWVLDGEGRAMHKSVGNVLWPTDVVHLYGGEVVRWWALATDWRSDVRVGDKTLRHRELKKLGVPEGDPAWREKPGDEILERCADAYRKVRNTFRFLLGNLGDFSPADALPRERLLMVDRAFAEMLDARLARVKEAWESLQFHRALDLVLGLCTVDLSAVFLDVSKDRLYTLAPADPARRSAQTVLWQALHDLAIAISPALVFTAEEVWQHHPALLAESESVHLALWPERGAGGDEEWEFLHAVRDAVNAAIEPLRAAKTLAGNAGAEVTIHAPAEAASRLRGYGDELAPFLLVARAEIDERAGEIAVDVRVTGLPKCERCWTHRDDVAAGGVRAGVCAKCTGALEAIGK